MIYKKVENIMGKFREFIRGFVGRIGHFLSTKAWTTGKTKVMIAICFFIIGILVTVGLLNSNPIRNRLLFTVNQMYQIPGWKYEPITSPYITYDKVPNEKKVNVRYDFSYSYIDKNKRNSKAEIHITCPTKNKPKVITKNKIEKVDTKNIDEETTEFILYMEPKAPENQGYVEIQISLINEKDEFDINVNGFAYDKFLFWYIERYNAGSASYHFSIVEKE